MKLTTSLLLMLSLCLVSCELDPDFNPGGPSGDTLQADFSYQTQGTSKCYAPCTVNFTNTSLGATEYAWDFGDGNMSNEANPSHEFDLGGEYTVKLTARDDEDNESIEMVMVNIPTPITFERNYGDANTQIAHQVVTTEDGGYAIVGVETGGGTINGYLLRIDSVGNPVFGFPKVYGQSEIYQLYGLDNTDDGGFILTGRSGTNNGLLIRTDQAGNVVGSFPKEYIDDENTSLASVSGEAVRQLPDGGFGFLGFSQNYRGGSGQGDFVYYRTNPSGDQTKFSFFTYDEGWSDEEVGGWVFNGTNTFFAVGATQAGGTQGKDFAVVEFDISGNLAPGFPKFFGGSEYDLLQAVCADPGGGYAAAGKTYSSGEGESDVFFVKINANGDPVLTSQITFGGPSEEQSGAIKATKDNGFIIVGETESFGQGGTDMYIIRLDSDGEEVFTITKGGFNDDFATDVLVTDDGGFLIIGSTTRSGGSDLNTYVVKTDAKGRVL